MELRRLRYFVAVAQEQSFTRASDRLAIAQPALSRQVQLLEDEVGVALLDHGARPVALTKAGRFFYARAIHLLSQVDELRTMTRRVAQIDRSLIIGFVASTLYGAMPEVLRRFRARLPDVELTLIEVASIDQLTELRGRRIDVGFGRRVFEDADVDSVVLRQEEHLVAMSAQHAARRADAVTLAEIAAQTLIIYPSAPRPSYADEVLALFRENDVSPSSVQEVREVQVALGLVAAGFGCCVVPASVSRLQRDDVVYRRLAVAGASTSIVMSTVAGEKREEIKTLKAMIDALYAERNAS